MELRKALFFNGVSFCWVEDETNVEKEKRVSHKAVKPSGKEKGGGRA